MLAIELDGFSHHFEDTYKKDLKKEKILNQLGITGLHFWDQEVFNDTDNVFRVIENYIEEYETPHPQPLSIGEPIP